MNKNDWIINSEDFWIKKDESEYPRFVISEPNNSNQEYFEFENNKIVLLNDKLFLPHNINSNKAELIFIFGVNSINEIEEVYKLKNDKSIIIVIEPDPGFLVHILNNKKLDIFKKENIYLFIDKDISNLSVYLNKYFYKLHFLELIKNNVFYFTDFYRNYNQKKLIEIMKLLKSYLRNVSLNLGNSIEDSLQGLEQNMNNIKWLMKSKSSAEIKNKFLNKPAIIVSAGPSLNRNLNYLKKAKGKAIIIAVDTIAERLIKTGIIPDFICAVERVSEIYDYYFKNKDYPKEMSLIGPLLLDENIFESFKGELFLPLRRGVYEFEWLRSVMDILDNDHTIFMGSSCAHVALGWASHLGCSPIILAGQDLAYGENENETHASGTHHSDNLASVNHNSDILTDGYMGGEVLTHKTWLAFKQQFEGEIFSKNLNVINATEGGAKILYTKQQSLKAAIEQYCSEQIENVYEVVKGINSFKFDVNIFSGNIESELTNIKKLKHVSLVQLSFMQNVDIKKEYKKNTKKLLKQIEKIDAILWDVIFNPLFMHNLQPMVLRYLWRRNEKERIISIENFEHDQEIQLELLSAIVGTLDLMERYIKNGIDKIKGE